MLAVPADIVNAALDAIGAPDPIGSLEDGTRASEVARRTYGATLRGLLRSAHWAFARKEAALELLGDASGQSPRAGTVVQAPWQYAYGWPIDGVQARWMPAQLTPPASAGVPIMTNMAASQTSITSQPARFLVSSSDQYPIVSGDVPWDGLPDLHDTEGVGLTSRRVILTNAPNAVLVYTKLALEIEEWDPLFSCAMVAVLASRLAMPVIPDKKFAIQLRAQQVALAREAIAEARAASANDSGFPQTANHTPDWFLARGAGSAWAWGNLSETGPGSFYVPWSAFAFADGSVF